MVAEESFNNKCENGEKRDAYLDSGQRRASVLRSQSSFCDEHGVKFARGCCISHWLSSRSHMFRWSAAPREEIRIKEATVSLKKS